MGTIAGSAVTAVLWRLESDESWFRGRSHCRKCKRNLSARELVPIISWLVQKGRCLGCKSKIAASYPLIELVTGLLFAFGFAARFGLDGAVISADPVRALLVSFRDFFAIAVLLIIFVFDYTKGLILDRVTLPAIVIIAAASLVLGMGPIALFAGVLIGAGFFWLQYLISRGRWIGGGDIRLGALMGALLGWNVIAALFFAYITGAIVGVGLILSGRKEWVSKIPFGTFLSVAAIFTLYFGDAIVKWYVR